MEGLVRVGRGEAPGSGSMGQEGCRRLRLPPNLQPIKPPHQQKPHGVLVLPLAPVLLLFVRLSPLLQDIDNFAVEHAILGALKADPAAMALVDEFFFEEHVKFKEMLVHWQGSVGPDTSLASSFALFHGLRQQGLRAHSWV